MNYDINFRILELRKFLKLSQTDFGKGLGVSRGVIKNIDENNVEAKPLLIEQICKVYNVNHAWLLTGEGEMFQELSEDEELAQMFGAALGGDMDPRRKRAIKSIMEMIRDIPDEFIPIVGEYAQKLADALNGNEKEDGEK